jgi:hypothetical protein
MFPVDVVESMFCSLYTRFGVETSKAYRTICLVRLVSFCCGILLDDWQKALSSRLNAIVRCQSDLCELLNAY